LISWFWPEAGKAAPITGTGRGVNRFTIVSATELVDTAFITQTDQWGDDTMRGLLVLIGLIALAVVVLMSMGMMTVNWPAGSMPSVAVDINGGKLPEVKTGTVGVGTTNTTVALPTVEMKNTTVTLPTIEVKQAPGATPTPAAK
jgi:hypothetical protein